MEDGPERPSTTTDPYTPEGWVEAWRSTTARRPGGPVVDVHAHTSVPEAMELARPVLQPEMEPRMLYSSPATKTLNAAFHRLVEDKFLDPDVRIADMDAMGVDVQMVALSPLQYCYWADRPLSARLSAMQNEAIAALAAHRSERLRGVGTLPMAHPEVAVAEVARIGGLGFTAVELGADVNGDDLDDPRFEPVWDAIEAAGLAVILHPAGFTEARRLTDYYLVNVVGMPLASTLAVTRMILGGVFERHPALRMVVVHGGGYLPSYWARTDHAFRHRPEMRGHIDRLPSEYLGRLHFDTTVFDPGLVETLVARYGAGRVMLGTDYPFDMGETDPLGLLAGTALTADQVDRVAGGNAVDMFGLG